MMFRYIAGILTAFLFFGSVFGLLYILDQYNYIDLKPSVLFTLSTIPGWEEVAEAYKLGLDNMSFLRAREAELAARAEELAAEAKKLEENIRKLSVRLDYFEKEGLEKADKLIQSAGLSFSLGNMNYTEWAVTVNNAVNLKREYLNTLMEYNQLVIELEYLTQNALK